MADATDRPGELPGAMTPTAALTLTTPDASDELHPVERPRPSVRYAMRIAHLGLLLREGTRSEVVDGYAVSPLPNTPRWLLGLTNLRGNLLPVFDPHVLLEVANGDDVDAQASARTLLVLGQGDAAAGLLIDGLPRIQSPQTHDVLSDLPPLPARLRAHASCGYRDEGILWMDFDHHGFFTALRAELKR